MDPQSDAVASAGAMTDTEFEDWLDLMLAIRDQLLLVAEDLTADFPGPTSGMVAERWQSRIRECAQALDQLKATVAQSRWPDELTST